MFVENCKLGQNPRQESEIHRLAVLHQNSVRVVSTRLVLFKITDTGSNVFTHTHVISAWTTTKHLPERIGYTAGEQQNEIKINTTKHNLQPEHQLFPKERNDGVHRN